MIEQPVIHWLPMITLASTFLGGAYGLVQGSKVLLKVIDRHIEDNGLERHRKERELYTRRKAANALTQFRRKDNPRQWESDLENILQGWQGKIPKPNPKAITQGLPKDHPRITQGSTKDQPRIKGTTMYTTPKGIGTKHPRRRKPKVNSLSLSEQIATFQAQGGAVTRITQGVTTFDHGLLLCKCGCAGRVAVHKEEE